VRYLAALFGATDENVMRWFILVVALLLDPAAVLLLLAAGSPFFFGLLSARALFHLLQNR
jgi:hypothetical protein